MIFFRFYSFGNGMYRLWLQGSASGSMFAGARRSQAEPVTTCDPVEPAIFWIYSRYGNHWALGMEERWPGVSEGLLRQNVAE